MAMFPEGQLFIDGKLHSAEGGKLYDDISPWTGEVIAQAADASPSDVDAAIVAARRAFDETDWSTDHDRRLELVKKYRDIFRANQARLVELSRNESGAAVGAAYSAHVEGALAGADALIDCFPDVAWREERGHRFDYGFTTNRILLREPMGVVGAITPWNVPFYVAVGKVFAALLAGCTVILKPAPDTPLSGVIFGELAIEAGLPNGVLNVITSADPAMAGEMLVTDKRVDLISFTGSTAVGKRIMEKGAPTLKRVFLELGGKSAGIVLDDAPNFVQAVQQSMCVYHAGQGCANITRLLVPKSRYAEAVDALEQAYAGYADHWGAYDEPTHVMGPVISRRQLDRVMSYIEIGKQEGARLIAGGNARPDKGNGFFVEPTCFVDATNDMRIAREEIFGPVLVVIPFEDDEDAIRIANDSDYGLCGGVYSGDEARAMRIVSRIRTGTMSVNGGMCIAPDVPFGGYKNSGVGREWGREGIEEFCETKLVGIALPA